MGMQEIGNNLTEVNENLEKAWNHAAQADAVFVRTSEKVAILQDSLKTVVGEMLEQLRISGHNDFVTGMRFVSDNFGALDKFLDQAGIFDDLENTDARKAAQSLRNIGTLFIAIKEIANPQNEVITDISIQLLVELPEELQEARAVYTANEEGVLQPLLQSIGVTRQLIASYNDSLGNNA